MDFYDPDEIITGYVINPIKKLQPHSLPITLLFDEDVYMNDIDTSDDDSTDNTTYDTTDDTTDDSGTEICEPRRSYYKPKGPFCEIFNVSSWLPEKCRNNYGIYFRQQRAKNSMLRKLLENDELNTGVYAYVCVVYYPNAATDEVEIELFNEKNIFIEDGVIITESNSSNNVIANVIKINANSFLMKTKFYIKATLKKDNRIFKTPLFRAAARRTQVLRRYRKK